jgi:RNA polymerase subunit RPABC4/transcription elongation factor Spt4
VTPLTKIRVCPYCGEEAGGVSDGHDETFDYCHTCDKLIEGETVEKEVCPSCEGTEFAYEVDFLDGPYPTGKTGTQCETCGEMFEDERD